MYTALWIVALLSTLAAGWLCYRADRRRFVPAPWLTASLRSLLIFLVWLLLLSPGFSRQKTETLKPVLLFLQDESTSVPIALKADTARYREALDQARKKLSGKYRVISWGFGSGILQDSLNRFKEPATNIAAALSRAAETFGKQNLGAIVLSSDGRFNEGEHPLYAALPLRAPLYTIALGDSTPEKDLRIARIYAPQTVVRGSVVSVRTDVLATACAGYSGTVALTEARTQVASQPLSIAADRYDRGFTFSISAEKPGLHHYLLTVAPASGERNVANNRKDLFIEVVEEKKKILLAATAPHPDIAAIREAIGNTGVYELVVRSDGSLPADLQSYDAVILHNPAAENPALAAAKRPLWVIAGPGATPMNNEALPLPARWSSSSPRDVQGIVAGSFSLFNLPARIGAVSDKLPAMLSGAAGITPDPRSVSLFNFRSADGSPLWSLRSGAPASALLLGEGLWRWRLYEYRYFRSHAVVDECIRQTIAFLTANPAEKPFRVELPKYEWSDAESVSLTATLLNSAGEAVNDEEAVLKLTDSAGRTVQYSFERNGSGYRLQPGILPGGTYRYTASTQRGGKTYVAAGSFAVNSIPLEALESGADYPLLQALAAKYEGVSAPLARLGSITDSLLRNDNIRPLLQSHIESVPLIDWRWYFFLILLVAVAEWLLRKYWLAM